jgi:Raf kinase inhibitor-like YbhB/YbcL family protein
VIAQLLSVLLLTLSSPALHSGGAIPKRFTCDGAGISPPLRWTAPPRGTRSLALLVEDVSTPQVFKHWLAWGISPRRHGLAVGARPPRQGRNDFGRVGYGGPCPPSGDNHRYVFRLYALRKPLGLRSGASAQQFRRALRGDVLRIAELVGRYRRRE